MNFDFSEDQRLLQKAARDFLEDRSPLPVNRKVLESGSHFDPELWKGVAEMGWLGAVVPEEYGGAGFGHLELVLIAEEIGRALAPVPFGSSVYLATEALLLAGTPEQRKSYLPRLAGGDLIGTLALADSLGDPAPNSIQTRLEGTRLNGTKVAVPDGNAAGLAVVVAQDDNGPLLALTDLNGTGVERTAVDSIDPTRSCANITFRDAPAERLGEAGQGWALLETLLDRAAVLLAFEQVGAADRAFEITREYTMGRYAFGRPVGSFQSLKHRMADIYAALELARSNSYYGAWALSEESDELGLAACSARVSATEAFELSSQEMIQMHGGVGFTWEYDCHMFYRRSKQQAVTLGSPSHWRERLIQLLVARPTRKRPHSERRPKRSWTPMPSGRRRTIPRRAFSGLTTRRRSEGRRHGRL
jgi:alkylation response protein AidB-like acyl-CoA dehydrogenase